MKSLFLKSVVISFSLLSGLNAIAFSCKGTDSANNIVSIEGYLDRANTAVFKLTVGQSSYEGWGTFKRWSDSNMGHSRCPGRWSGFTVEGGQQAALKSFTITTDSDFFGCGMPPSDSAVIDVGGQTETIQLECKK